MARVLMLLSNEYRPDIRVEKEARGLEGAGHRVTVAAWDRMRSRPQEEGTAPLVKRVRTRTVTSMTRLVLNYPRFILGLLSIARETHPQVVHAHDLDTLVPGILISRLHRIPLVYDAHEHYAKMVEVDLPSALSPLIDLLEFLLVPRAEFLIVANRKIEEYLSPHFGGDIVEVMNCVDLPDRVVRGKRDGDPVLIYGGTLEPKRYVEEVLDAVDEVPGCRLIVAGRGRLAQLVEERASRNEAIRFLGYIPHDRLMEEMAAADGVLCLLDPGNENNVIGTPNRMFEAMAVGVPSVVTKGTLSGDMVTEAGCGIAIDWSLASFRELVELLEDGELMNGMGENGRRAAEAQYNWEEMRSRLVRAYSLLQLRS